MVDAWAPRGHQKVWLLVVCATSRYLKVRRAKNLSMELFDGWEMVLVARITLFICVIGYAAVCVVASSREQFRTCQSGHCLQPSL